MSTIQDIRVAVQNATRIIDRALPELGYNDLVAIFDDAEQLFVMLTTALESRKIPEPLPAEVTAADAAADAAELAKFGAKESHEDAPVEPPQTSTEPAPAAPAAPATEPADPPKA